MIESRYKNKGEEWGPWMDWARLSEINCGTPGLVGAVGLYFSNRSARFTNRLTISAGSLKMQYRIKK